MQHACADVFQQACILACVRMATAVLVLQLDTSGFAAESHCQAYSQAMLRPFTVPGKDVVYWCCVQHALPASVTCIASMVQQNTHLSR